MRLQVNEAVYVSEIEAGDKAAYLVHLKEKEISDNTLNIPYPYTEKDADWWLAHVAEQTHERGRSVNWAVRRQDGYLIGGIGFMDLHIGKSHKAEIGYWLAKPYWGQGIMTATVKNVCDYAFAELTVVRITANVFAFNARSARVLEKAGFQLEGLLRKHYVKDGRMVDGKMYALLKAGME